MKPLVSILIPAYNAGPWMADTIRSALAQTWLRREIIIVDDGSRDETATVARQFASPEVQVVTQENQGASAARNKAYSLCQGDYIQWLDADDLLAPEKIACQMEAVAKEANPRTLFSSQWGRFISRPGQAKFEVTPLWTDVSPAEWVFLKLSQNLHMQPATWLVSRELTEAAGPWDVRLSLDDDGEYFCRVIMASRRINFVPGARMYYRMSGLGSLSVVDQSDKKLESLWLSMKLHVRYMRALEDSERARAACVTYLQNWLGNFYPRRMDIVGEARELAVELGGTLREPELPAKYRLFQKILGRAATRKLQANYNRQKVRVQMLWDQALHRREKDQSL